MKKRIQEIEHRIQAACERAGRDRSEVTLIAVSKTKPISMIEEAYELGMRHFGENKVQELATKYEALENRFDEKIYWHQIGHLQRNKVKQVVDKAVLIHSVDSLRLGQQIEEEAAKKDIVCNILVEVNIAKEDTKFGISEEEVLPLILELVKLPHLKVRGLMTIAPFTENSEKNRMYFRKLRELFIDIKTKNIDNTLKGNFVQSKINNLDNGKMPLGNFVQSNIPTFSDFFDILSMGMTGDFEVAIEEGATMVRVGTGIFGERDYSAI